MLILEFIKFLRHPTNTIDENRPFSFKEVGSSVVFTYLTFISFAIIYSIIVILPLSKMGLRPKEPMVDYAKYSIISIVLLAPIGEELLFRAILRVSRHTLLLFLA